MKIRIKWLENACLVGESESGHCVVMDGVPEIGGRNIGIRPMEMVLLGLGGCTAMDVISILRKSRQAITDCEIEVSAERANTEPKVFTRIHIHFIVSGRELKQAQVKRAVDLSAEKYCSVSHMLNKTAEISHDFEVIEQT
ncbi:MAG: OsmC family protein [Gammaproteobacteria bacterium]|nr:OsmC family protein [Gammaproteobacteria bacterium]